ncbi:probable G-protein coupled receptor 141 [Centroberyx affinis]|uniref:probable G-protein coupled receptor 141 n=1 Tax=Centroberyx affinis TaxID=166261 RepID=UPI003A5C553A
MTTLPSNMTPATPGLEATSIGQKPVDPVQYHAVLLSIYSVVLLSGTIGIGLMAHILQSSMKSITTIAVLNLIFTHFLFLLTVPFRIYYHANNHWGLGLGLCKIVSAMIHVHMYMSFIFYVIILVTRLMTFYRKAEQVEFYRKMHALAISVAVWMVVVVTVPCVLFFIYGKQDENDRSWHNYNSSSTHQTQVTHCFQFGSQIESANAAKVFNYAISIVIIVVATTLTVFQANVLLILHREHGPGCTSQQEFWAQLKSLCFALVMMVCFVPYHMFRLHYIGHLKLQAVNEVFLSLTTLTCLDMLTFVGRGVRLFV